MKDVEVFERHCRHVSPLQICQRHKVDGRIAIKADAIEIGGDPVIRQRHNWIVSTTSADNDLEHSEVAESAWVQKRLGILQLASHLEPSHGVPTARQI